MKTDSTMAVTRAIMHISLIAELLPGDSSRKPVPRLGSCPGAITAMPGKGDCMGRVLRVSGVAVAR